MIAQFDVNTIWRRKFGQALQRRLPETLLFAPHGLQAPKGDRIEGAVPVTLPPGWASRTSSLAMPILAHRARAIARHRGGTIDMAIFSSFHYLPLARSMRGEAQLVYYCSDDYRGYAGWGGDAAIAREAELCRMASLSVFVSAALRNRAIAEYELDPATCIVAPNASEQRFTKVAAKPAELAALPGPVFGTVGVFNDRIDFAFLDQVANRPEVGSLALVGPLQDCPDRDGSIKRLRENPKVHWMGAKSHDEIHTWMAGMDVAVIPYAKTQLNHFCSPMRLWDHLAIGQPILATDACDQIARQSGVFVVRRGDELDQTISSVKTAAEGGRHPQLESWDDRVALLVPWIS
ncbi:MAG: glycosyltransferase [Pseudomonadota bacterium]